LEENDTWIPSTASISVQKTLSLEVKGRSSLRVEENGICREVIAESGGEWYL